MLKALMYLFESHINEIISFENDDSSSLSKSLQRAGFRPEEVQRAMHWIGDFIVLREQFAKEGMLNASSVRLYNEEEKSVIPLQVRGFISYLEKMEILKPKMRELVIDRLMALHHGTVDVADAKWVTLMVLCCHPEEKQALMLMQDFALYSGSVH